MTGMQLLEPRALLPPTVYTAGRLAQGSKTQTREPLMYENRLVYC